MEYHTVKTGLLPCFTTYIALFLFFRVYLKFYDMYASG